MDYCNAAAQFMSWVLSSGLLICRNVDPDTDPSLIVGLADRSCMRHHSRSKRFTESEVYTRGLLNIEEPEVY